MSAKKTIASMTRDDAADLTLEHAASEVDRELQVRARLYDRWIAEGKISYIDAKDRFLRLMWAAEFLQKAVDLNSAE